jgi:hypothetical protein
MSRWTENMVSTLVLTTLALDARCGNQIREDAPCSF